MTEITMKDGKKYISNLDYDYVFNLICMLDGIKLNDINGNDVSIRGKDIERITKVR